MKNHFQVLLNRYSLVLNQSRFSLMFLLLIATSTSLIPFSVQASPIDQCDYHRAMNVAEQDEGMKIVDATLAGAACTIACIPLVGPAAIVCGVGCSALTGVDWRSHDPTAKGCFDDKGEISLPLKEQYPHSYDSDGDGIPDMSLQ